MGGRFFARIRAIGIAVAALALVFGVTTVGAMPAKALSGSDFRAGYIVSDANFYDYNSMSADQIEAFIQAKVPRCQATNGVPCLRDFVGATATRSANSYCSQYTGSAGDNAGWTIYKVAQACRISPKVLLVLIQKESGLITSTNPTQPRYNVATGYGCPDTAPCDTQYYGFYNQVYKAAWQFRSYAAGGASWRYHVGNVSIQWSPNASCGAPIVNIQNQATASLYNYTPYQPNAAALANLNGTGDACSSYGNRNFWTYYWSWFGDPTGNSNPIGVIDNVFTGPDSISVNGWALDLDSSSSLSVHVYVDDQRNIVQASDERPDLLAPFPSEGSAHGFHTSFSGLAPGAHQLCVYAINVGFGGNSNLGCRTVSLATGSPVGVMDDVSVAAGRLVAHGWILDPDTVAPINASLSIDGREAENAVASGNKQGLSAAYPFYGDSHGYELSASSVTPGTHSVCVVGRNVGPGSDSWPYCRSVFVPSGTPFGIIDRMTGVPGSVTISGWVLDWDTLAPLTTHVSVDGVVKSTFLANQTKDGLGGYFAGYGDDHGFSTTITGLTSGGHQVCVIPDNVGPGAASNGICQRIVVPSGPPYSVIDSIYASPGAVDATGWALDPDTVDPISVKLTVDGKTVSQGVAGGPKGGLDASFPGYGDRHGFSLSASGLTNGTHTVCAVAVNVGPGSDSWPYCRSVTMPSGDPIGVIDSVDATRPGQMVVTGWMLDPDVSDPINVRLSVDGRVLATARADGTKDGLDSYFPHYGDNHLYSVSATGLTPGMHELCVAGVNVGGGKDGWPVCRQQSGPTGPPIGVIDSATVGSGTVRMVGWGIDQDTSEPIDVSIRVDGIEKSLVLANGVKTDLDKYFPGYGNNHLYDATVQVSAGKHQVCVFGLNKYGPDPATNYFDCRDLTVP